jgi:hypothetical protein
VRAPEAGEHGVDAQPRPGDDDGDGHERRDRTGNEEAFAAHNAHRVRSAPAAVVTILRAPRPAGSPPDSVAGDLWDGFPQ